ncbi:MAG: FAD-dependent oxidoreductase [Actinomycetota bacterium]|nr:FAD-dependent oxidoreductase [Actinomycetota bacterium]
MPRARTPEVPPERQQPPEPDIVAVGPAKGTYPLSRGAPERKLSRVDRYGRRAEVTAYETVTPTGTVRISFRVIDQQPFNFRPGQFVGIQADIPGFGVRKTPYCIISAPNAERTFQLLVRLVPEGPLSYYLGALKVGDVIGFRGPVGRSMIPKEEEETELVLIATGVGVGPFLSLVSHLSGQGLHRRMRLYWGLRLAEDICLRDELEELVRASEDFSYQISLSQPPERWTGLRGRVTESVPPLLETLGGKHFYLVGNGAMIEEMSEALSDLGVFKNLIYQEHYFNARYKPDEAALDRLRKAFVARDLTSPRVRREAVERERRPQKGTQSASEAWERGGL